MGICNVNIGMEFGVVIYCFWLICFIYIVIGLLYRLLGMIWNCFDIGVDLMGELLLEFEDMGVVMFSNWGDWEKDCGEVWWLNVNLEDWGWEVILVLCGIWILSGCKMLICCCGDVMGICCWGWYGVCMFFVDVVLFCVWRYVERWDMRCDFILDLMFCMVFR